MQTARQWIAAFERLPAEDWPKHLTEATFSRSSGPGGQHVNRTMSKAILRLPLPSPSFLPPYLLPHLHRSPHFSSSALLVSSSTHRTQHTNLAECFSKLKAAILEAAKKDLVGETSEEQKKRVKGLVASEKRRTEKKKKMRKSTKEGRGKHARAARSANATQHPPLDDVRPGEPRRQQGAAFSALALLNTPQTFHLRSYCKKKYLID